MEDPRKGLMCVDGALSVGPGLGTDQTCCLKCVGGREGDRGVAGTRDPADSKEGAQF